MQYNKKGFIEARQRGYRSHLEETIANQITKAKHSLRYEEMKIKWIDFAIRAYTPDFVLDNGIIIEVKGFWATGDRRKHVEIQQQHPNLDIRFIFSNTKSKISKKSKTTYAMWCEKYGFKFANKHLPLEWL